MDRGTGSVPAFLAHELGNAQALGLVEVDTGHAVDRAVDCACVRRLDGGRREVLDVAAPAVLSVEGSVRRLRRAPLAAARRVEDRRHRRRRDRRVGDHVATGDRDAVPAAGPHAAPHRPGRCSPGCARSSTSAEPTPPTAETVELDPPTPRRASSTTATLGLPRRRTHPARRRRPDRDLIMRLGDATWPDVGAATRVGRSVDGVLTPVLLIPVGSTEQHGPHLPLATDTLIAEEIAGRAIHLTDGLMVGPTISVSASGEHAGFPRHAVDRRDRDGQRRARAGAQRRLGGGCGVRQRPRRQPQRGHPGGHPLTAERRNALAWWPKWPQRADGGPRDLHAGRIETSLMLAIDPGLVRFELAEAGPDASIDDLREPRACAPSARPACSATRATRPAVRANGSSPMFVEDLVHEVEKWRPIDPTPHGSTGGGADERCASSVDGSWRRYGRVVVAGSPLRIFRLTAAGAAVADGARRPASPWRRSRLVDRLLDGGAIHPPTGTARPTVHRRRRHRRHPAARRRRWSTDGPARGRRRLATRPRRRGAVGSPTNRGPAAARNAGRALVTTPLIAFVDADVTLPPAGSTLLLPHFDDDTVGLVAPRVTGERRSPLDLGAAAGPDPRRHAGSATCPVRRSSCAPTAFDAVGGFDERLRFGEDVDLVWRLDERGWACRYEPASTVDHAPRPTLARPDAPTRRVRHVGRTARPAASRRARADGVERLDRRDVGARRGSGTSGRRARRSRSDRRRR